MDSAAWDRNPGEEMTSMVHGAGMNAPRLVTTEGPFRREEQPLSGSAARAPQKPPEKAPAGSARALKIIDHGGGAYDLVGGLESPNTRYQRGNAQARETAKVLAAAGIRVYGKNFIEPGTGAHCTLEGVMLPAGTDPQVAIDALMNEQGWVWAGDEEGENARVDDVSIHDGPAGRSIAFTFYPEGDNPAVSLRISLGPVERVAPDTWRIPMATGGAFLVDEGNGAITIQRMPNGQVKVEKFWRDIGLPLPAQFLRAFPGETVPEWIPAVGGAPASKAGFINLHLSAIVGRIFPSLHREVVGQ